LLLNSKRIEKEMEGNEQIERFKVFIETNYKKELYDTVKKGKNSVLIDFGDLSTHDPELADALLEQPEDLIRAAELALEPGLEILQTAKR